MEQTLICRETLAKRWDFKSTKAIEKYEQDGVLTRNPNFRVPRYYLEEVLKIEALGDINPLSPLERARKDRRIKELEKEVEMLKGKLNAVRQALI